MLVFLVRLHLAFILCIIYLNMLILIIMHIILHIIGCYLYLFSLLINRNGTGKGLFGLRTWQGPVWFENVLSVIILCFPVYYTLLKCHLDFTIQLIYWYQDLYGMGIIKVAFLWVNDHEMKTNLFFNPNRR